MEGMEIKKRDMNIKKANVLITGGCGFIGGHLVERLISKGANITVLDIILDPKSIFAQNNLTKLVNLQIIDIRDRDKVLKTFKKYKPSYIIHLAAQPIVENAYFDPYETFETNIMGTVNILDAIRLIGGVKGVIIASSDKAYGKSDRPYKEDFPLRGDHPYDVSKSCQDLIAQSYYKTYKLPIVITRFGNVYGEGDFHFGRIIPDICKSVVQKKTLLLRSDGQYVRDYIYVNDVVDGYIMLFENIGKISGEAYNFSSADTLSVLEVVKKSEQTLGVKITYKILNTAQNEIPYQHLDDSKIRRKLGWKAKHNLGNSLRKVLLWYEKCLRKNK